MKSLAYWGVAFTLAGLFYSTSLAYPVECLYDSVFVEIKGNYTAEITFKRGFRFREARTEDYSVIRIPVNSYIDFDFIAASTTLPDGRIIDLNKNDIETISDFTPQYYPDSKSKIIYLPSPRPEAQSKVSYKLIYKSLLYLPRFFRQRDIPTLDSYLQVKSEIPVSFYATDEFESRVKDDSTHIFFERAIPPMIQEMNSPPNEDYQIFIKPDSVVYLGNKYGFDTWSDVAHFYNALSNPGNSRTASIRIRQLADSLIQGAGSRSDSLQALLDFMLDGIRYISVDIGRGEFKPLDPLDVLNKRYGDCKDQAALLTALCNAIGFEANPALMTTRGQPDILLSLPWPGYFNHVITAVDTGNGYMFLDASRPTCCFGNLPFALRNRRALICGSEPFLDFTLTSPFEQGNDIDIKISYTMNQNDDLSAEVDIRLYKDPAFIFQAKTDEQVVSNVLGAFFGDDISGRYRSGFKVSANRPDYVHVTGLFFDKLTKAPKSNRLMLNIRSPFIRLLRKYFTPPGRIQPYEFEFGFNVNEKVSLFLDNGYEAEKDSLDLSFNERGVRVDINLRTDNKKCEIVKNFRLFDYSLSSERYNSVVDFLLTASQIPYNSIELMPSNEEPGD